MTQPVPDDRDLEALSAQLRALARQLVRDPSSADDLVQEAWLAALDRPQSTVRELGAWLRTVVRNHAVRSARREALRRGAQERWAGTESTRETEEFLERANIALALRDAANELTEPVRSVIVVHYFEGRTIEATAQHLGRPLETVRSQRRRGIEELRAVLDRRHRGARRDWLAALVPLLGGRRPGVSKWRWAALVAPAAVLIGAIAMLRTPAQPTTQQVSEFASVDAGVAAESAASDRAGDEASARHDVPSQQVAVVAENPNDTPAVPEVATRHFAARVTDPAGEPVDGALLDVLGLDGAQLGPFATDADGRAEFELRADRLSYRASFARSGGIVVHARAPGRAKSPLAIVPATENEQEFELQLGGPGQTLTGVVVDPGGSPLAGAHVELDNEDKEMVSAPNGVVLLEDLRRAVTGSDGRFALEYLPRRVHRWVARAKDWGIASGAIDGDTERLELTIVLPRGVELTGFVRGADGAPAVDAEVWVARGVSFNLLAPHARTDDRGRYRLLGLTESPLRIFARAANGGNESADALHVFANGVERSELDLELRTRPALEIRCANADGSPAAAGMVVLETEPGAPAPWRQSVSTDAEGRAVYPVYPLGGLMVQLVPVHSSGEVLRRMFDSRVTTRLDLRIGGPERASASAVHAVLIDPWHDSVQARVVAVSSADGSTLQAAVEPNSGVLEALELPAGERRFFAIDEFGVMALGAARLDGVSAHDLGVHTLGSARTIEIEWALAGGAELTWLIVAQLTNECEKEVLLRFAYGRTRFELRDSSYQLVGRTPSGVDRIVIPFSVGDGHPVRLRVP